MKYAFFAVALLLVSGACTPEKPLRPKGQFGVFYGEQIQERAELGLEGLRDGQLGFRVSVPANYRGGREIRARITRPGPLGRRVTEHLELAMPDGKNEISSRVSIPSGALGVWNVRVEVGGVLAVDRAVLVQRRTDGTF